MRHKILVVDDNADAAEMEAELLRVAGHDVQVAFDGPSALVLVESFVPDVALLDLGLPVMDGYELAAQLRQRLHPHRVRVIAVSGYAPRPHPRRARARGGVRPPSGKAR